MTVATRVENRVEDPFLFAAQTLSDANIKIWYTGEYGRELGSQGSFDEQSPRFLLQREPTLKHRFFPITLRQYSYTPINPERVGDSRVRVTYKLEDEISGLLGATNRIEIESRGTSYRIVAHNVEIAEVAPEYPRARVLRRYSFDEDEDKGSLTGVIVDAGGGDRFGREALWRDYVLWDTRGKEGLVQIGGSVSAAWREDPFITKVLDKRFLPRRINNGTTDVLGVAIPPVLPEYQRMVSQMFQVGMIEEFAAAVRNASVDLTPIQGLSAPLK